MHTEEQAKKLWCPMVRHNSPADEGSGSFNMGPKGLESNADGGAYHCCCIASKCAMWRWSDTKPARAFRQARNTTATSNPGDPEEGWVFVPYNEKKGQFFAGWFEPEHLTSARRQGYCGLAGRAQRQAGDSVKQKEKQA